MASELAVHCIYTILHIDDFRDKARKREPASFDENKARMTGHALWEKVQKDGEDMAQLLGDASDCSELL